MLSPETEGPIPCRVLQSFKRVRAQCGGIRRERAEVL